MQVQHGQSQEEVIEALQHEVDELRAANRSLQDQLARKERFTAMIAHELRGPLSPIINYAQILTRNLGIAKDDPKKASSRGEATQRQLNIIISQARRLARLVNDLLDSSHLTSGQFTLLRAECDITKLAREAVEYLRPVAPYHEFSVEAPETPIIGNWDSGRLQQALGNLLDNAIKYSDEGTVITLRIRPTEEGVRISVHNQGASIPSTDIAQLFHPYTRVQATSGARQGYGLGLYITKSIIEAHGGKLRLEPHTEEHTQQGTTFSFDLPLQP
ncbi:sensor histidine kinase [Ktedonosporobacter rubrisoli]|nr:HAMP domain-containing sensor histidine kinase [Ktedonosporobacter rubrisoli]